MSKTITVYGNEDVDFIESTKKKIKESGMVIFRGLGTKLVGWRSHECDCPLCEVEGEEFEKFFMTKNEALEYIEENDIRESSIEEDGIHYIKAVEQLPMESGGLFSEEEE